MIGLSLSAGKFPLVSICCSDSSSMSPIAVKFTIDRPNFIEVESHVPHLILRFLAIALEIWLSYNGQSHVEGKIEKGEK